MTHAAAIDVAANSNYHDGVYLTGVSDLIFQDGATLSIAGGFIESAVFPTTDSQWKLFSFYASITIASDGAGSGGIVWGLSNMLQQIPSAPAAYDLPWGYKAFWQGTVSSRDGGGILGSPGVPTTWDVAYLLDFGGNFIIDPILDGDTLTMNATWMMGED